MKNHRVENFTRGWFIGDFSPSALRTEHFEAGLRLYRKGDREDAHVHRIVREFTVIGSGRFRMNDLVLEVGDIVEVAPGDATDFECLADGVTFVVKMPSVPNDKHLVHE